MTLETYETKAQGGDTRGALSELLTAFEGFRDANDERLKALEQKRADPLLEEKVERINKTLTEQKAALDRLAVKALRPEKSGRESPVDERKAAFSRYMRAGDGSALHALETKSVIAGVDSEGGYLAPDETERLIIALAAPAAPAALLAAFADPWGGAALYREGTAGPEFMATARSRATMGRLDDALPPGESGRWDDRSIRVRLSFGAFVSKSEEDVLAGANALAAETGAGFEIVQFREATLGSDGVWTLGPLLRGQSGTEDRAIGAAAGARIVLLNAALSEARYPLSLRGRATAFQAGPERDDPDTENFTGQSLTLTARGLMPLSPVHLGAQREDGGIRLSWIRRTRLHGDSFDGEVPLAEAYERYRVKIYPDAAAAAAGAPLRTIDVASFAPLPGEAGAGSGSGGAGDPRPNLLYTDEMILADFGAGGVGSGALFEVSQLSDLVGEGVNARRNLG